MNKVLYGLDKSGNLKTWRISVENNKITICFGKSGGKQQTKSEVIKGKNIGRSNETSDSEQAELEAMSRHRKQIDKGYRETKEELSEVPLAAMLSQDYTKKPHLIKFPCLVSKKIDGCRCLAIKKNGEVKLQSRGNKEYLIPHIQDALNSFMEEGDVLDGELYIEGLALQEIMSAVKKPNENTPDIQYLVFDTVTNEVFNNRYLSLAWLSSEFPENVKLVEHYTANNKEELKSWHDEFVQDGYEGLMIRNLKGRYESGKRSNDLSKMKEFMDAEFRIVDIAQDKDGGAIFVVQNKFADNLFNVVGGSHEERKQWWDGKSSLIDKWITVKYQALYEDTMKPQFPVLVAFRDVDANEQPLS